MTAHLALRGTLQIGGQVTICTQDLAGHVLHTITVPNQITYHTANALAAWLTGTINRGPQALHGPSAMELGTGSGTPSASDTALFAGVSATYQPCTELTTVSGTPDSPQWTAVWGGPSAGNIAGTYTEIGLFDPNGALFAHLAGLSIQVTTVSTTAIQWQWAITVD